MTDIDRGHAHITNASVFKSTSESGSMRYRLPAIIALIIIMSMPSDGIGVLLCPFHLIFDMPCPACGIVRSMSCLVHLEPARSFAYHPLGVFTLGFIILSAVTSRPEWISSKVKQRFGLTAGRTITATVISAFLTVWLFRLSGFMTTH